MEVMRRPSYQDNTGPKLKNESYSPPTFSRAPPDGDEFPPKYCESLVPSLPEKQNMPAENSESRSASVGRSYSLSSPPDYTPYQLGNKSVETNGYHTNETVARLNQLNTTGKSSNRWNSEECLTKPIKSNGRIFNRRESEKAPSVRDRIALFNKPETPVAGKSNGAPKQELPRVEDLQNKGTLSNGYGKECANGSCNGYSSLPDSDYKVNGSPVKTDYAKSRVVSEANVLELPPRRESIPGITSSYPQTQLTNHLRHSYAGQKTFEDYKRSISNGAGYTSVLDGRRASAATKLKGLIIPEKPPPISSSSKAFPTILSSTNSSPPRSSFPTNNAWNRNEQRYATTDGSKSNGSMPLSEPPWKATGYYETPQVFKSRSIELTKASVGNIVLTPSSALTCSVSPTPPSSVTSPLSPPPSSPSSVCSSSTSSSCGISKQSTFQFSLSHSKPVTPTLPEKPILVSPTPTGNIQNQDESLYTSEKSIFVATTKNIAPPLPRSAPPPLPVSEPPIVPSQNHETSKPVVTKVTEKSTESSNVTKLSALERLDSLVSFSYPVKLNSEISTDLVSPQRSTPPNKPDSRSNGNGLPTTTNTSSYIDQQSVTCEEISMIMNENGRMSSNSSVPNASESRIWSTRPASESDDDTNSVISLRTEDSRQTADDSLSDATTDSLDRNNHDPEFKPRMISQQRTVLRARMDSTDSVKNFRALAERWELRAGDTPEPVSRSNSNGLGNGSNSLTRKDSGRSTSSSINEGSVKLPPSLMPRCSNEQPEKEKGAFHSLPTTKSRSSSLSQNEKFKYNDSVDSLLVERSKRLSSMERSVSSFALDMVGGGNHEPTTRNRSSTLGPIGKSNRSVSVSDIRKTFESQKNIDEPPYVSKITENVVIAEPRREDLKQSNGTQFIKDHRSSSALICPTTTEIHHRRFSSMDSTASDSGVSTPAHYGSTSSLAAPSTGSRDLFGSVTSLASTSSLISAQELQQLIDEANQSLSEELSSLNNSAGLAGHEVTVVVLHKDTLSGSVGITLAGGADYEVKEITVHKVISGSLSDRDGRLRKGDRIISINGRNLKGVTHREALEILKSPRQEVVLVTSRERTTGSDATKPMAIKSERGMSLTANNQPRVIGTTPAISTVEKSSESVKAAEVSVPSSKSGQVATLELIKDGTGLGFSLEGGKDSPQGDKPLTVKRVFKGGAADREGNLSAGDEIISVNKQAVTSMTRTEAWNYMKKLPDGQVTIVVKKV